MSKRWTIAVDFDGVIHQYTSKFDIDELDPPMPGAFEWLEEMVKHFTVVIHSCRLTPHGDEEDTYGRELEMARALLVVEEGFLEHGLPQEVLDELEFWQKPGKPTALVYIDDRGFRFEGTFPSKKQIHQLRPWKYKEG